MSTVLVASVAIHTGLIATAFWGDRRPHDPPPREISVEVIQEPAKPPTPKPPTPKPPPAKPPQAAAPQKPAPKPQAAKPDATKPQATKSETKKPEPAKPETAKPEAPKPEATKHQPPPLRQKVASTRKPPQLARQEPEADALRKQLESLKAEQAALNAEHETLKPIPVKMSEAKVGPTGSERFRNLLGEPPPGMGAAALPGESANGTEAVSYKQLVMSKVAKAKKEGRYRGIPGYATVAFLIGDKGEVLSSKVERKSDDPSLDKEALDMIARGAPYPSPPPGAERMFVVTLQFRPTP